jgi:hypothetical protein
MTILADVGDFFFHQPGIPAAMWSVAGKAVLCHRRMIVNPWTTLVGMA